MAKNPLVKRANELHDYTVDEIMELKRCSKDPIYFIRTYCQIQHAVQGAIPFALRPYQERIINAFAGNRLVIALAPRQIGKALPLDTEIPTPSGMTTMGELKVGDYVLSRIGKPTRVVAVSDTWQQRPTYRIAFNTGETIIADENHDWNITVSPVDHAGTITVSSKEMYERWTNPNSPTPYMGVPVADSLDLPAIKFETTPYQYGKQVAEGTIESELDVRYLRSSSKQLTELMISILEHADTYSDDRTRRVYLKNANAAQFAADMFHANGLTAIIRTLPPEEQFDDNTHEVFFSGREQRAIVSITPGPSVATRCIEVDAKDHLFLITKSMIPTHNSWLAGAFLLWKAAFSQDMTILIASNKNDNAMEMISRVRFMYERLPHWLKPGISADGWNKHSVGFDNSSRIISQATTENTGRGLSISALFLDEFAFVRDTIAEEFWTSVSPTLATGGSCIICSTPNGDTNRFAQLWRGANIPSPENPEVGINGFAPVTVKWDEPPGRDQAFKDQETAKIGETRWLQEYECEFISSDPLLIDTVVLANLTSVVERVVPLKKSAELVIFKQPSAGNTYLIGVDPATGSGSDYTVMDVFEFPSMIQAAQFRSNTTSSPLAYQILKRLIAEYEKYGSQVFYTIESNGVGEGILSQYEADATPPEAAVLVTQGDNPKRLGMYTTGRSKIKACMTLKDLVERGGLTLNSIVTLTELKNYIRRGGSYAAKVSATDDTISALLLVIRMLTEVASYDQQAHDMLYSAGGYLDEAGKLEFDYSEEGVIDFI